MEPIYEWLYDHYAEPELRRLPVFQDTPLKQALNSATELERFDRVNSLRMHCCTAAFELGVRLGLALSAPDRS